MFLNIRQVIQNPDERRILSLKIQKNIDSYNSVAIGFICFFLLLFQKIYKHYESFITNNDIFKCAGRLLVFSILTIMVLMIVYKMYKKLKTIVIDGYGYLIVLLFFIIIIILTSLGVCFLYDFIVSKILLYQDNINQNSTFILMGDISNAIKYYTTFTIFFLVIFVISKSITSKLIIFIQKIPNTPVKILLSFIVFACIPICIAFVTYIISDHYRGTNINFQYLFPVTKKMITWLLIPIQAIYLIIMLCFVIISNTNEKQFLKFKKNEVFFGLDMNNIKYDPKIVDQSNKTFIYPLN